MGSKSDDKKQESAESRKKGQVVEGEHGHQLWEGTIKTIKLSLMKTGIFYQSEAQQRLIKLREAGADDDKELIEELEVLDEDEDGGFDPYDSANK